MPFEVARVTGSGFGNFVSLTGRRYLGSGGKYSRPWNVPRIAAGIGESGSVWKY